MYRIVPAIDSVIRMDDMLVIPRVDGNSDYEDFKQWLAEGNTAKELQFTLDENGNETDVPWPTFP